MGWVSSSNIMMCGILNRRHHWLWKHQHRQHCVFQRWHGIRARKYVSKIYGEKMNFFHGKHDIGEKSARNRRKIGEKSERNRREIDEKSKKFDQFEEIWSIKVNRTAVNIVWFSFQTPMLKVTTRIFSPWRVQIRKAVDFTAGAECDWFPPKTTNRRFKLPPAMITLYKEQSWTLMNTSLFWMQKKTVWESPVDTPPSWL